MCITSSDFVSADISLRSPRQECVLIVTNMLTGSEYPLKKSLGFETKSPIVRVTPTGSHIGNATDDMTGCLGRIEVGSCCRGWAWLGVTVAQWLQVSAKLTILVPFVYVHRGYTLDNDHAILRWHIFLRSARVLLEWLEFNRHGHRAGFWDGFLLLWVVVFV